jgi:nicotinate-nucleotide--dimethylbenzimidazole phosphoribosyltransferase
MPADRSLIAPTSNPLLEHALREALRRRNASGGGFGELEPLAVRLGLLQNTLRPRLRDPHVLLFASDHGLVVDVIEAPRRGTADLVRQVVDGQAPLAAFARLQGMALWVVDAGVAEPLPRHEHLLVRKIAHGTRNVRVHAAMSVEQAHAAIRAGMEIAEGVRGNAVVCAGAGAGGDLSAAMVLSRLDNYPLDQLLAGEPDDDEGHGARDRALALATGALARHRRATDPVEVLAALGGFEIAMMVGLILGATARRQLVMIDGMAACAALRVARCIASAVTDYCVFCRSHGGRSLDHAMALFQAAALLELGMDSIDGTGATLSWPLVKAAAALLSDVPDDDAGTSSRPGSLAGVTPSTL